MLIIIIIMITSLMCACAANADESSVDGEDGGELESINNINGEDGNKLESINSPNNQNRQVPVSAEEIEQSKNNTEQILFDNYDVFNQLVSFFENEPKRYICETHTGELVVTLDNEPEQEEIELSEVEMGGQIAYIMNDLGFETIIEYDDYVWFIQYSAMDPFGGSYNQGLFCNKSNVGENTITEWYEPPFGEIALIRDEWFFFYFRYNE